MAPELHIESFSFRAGYPNLYDVLENLEHRRSGRRRERGPGYRPPILDYRLVGDDETKSLNVRYEDVLPLFDLGEAKAKSYLESLLLSRRGDADARRAAGLAYRKLYDEVKARFTATPLIENDYVVALATGLKLADEQLSDKGAMLLDLAREGYPVPALSILTARSSELEEKHRFDAAEQAIGNLETMCGQFLGDNENPLIFAVRSAMPIYIPGLMPTYLNIGATERTLPALSRLYGKQTAAKIYLNNLKNIYSLLNPAIDSAGRPQTGSENTPDEIEKSIDFLSDMILSKDREILDDSHRQLFFFLAHTRQFYEDNADLIFTFTRGKHYHPAHILQKMVCTARLNDSYPGVLYSRHPRIGRGRLVESKPSIFGEEIMTGSIEADLDSFHDDEEIRLKFPALHHFVPALKELEHKLESPVMVEFGVEAIGRGNFVALIQLNRSEMSGPAAIRSAVDLYREGIVPEAAVVARISPLHLKQINAAWIDETSLSVLVFFCQGLAVLPKAAVSARVYFTSSAALEAKKRGERVCLCKKSFVPSDSVVMAEVDAILSLTPAAIHVVTACLGYGISTFLNLERYGVRFDDEAEAIVNDEGMRIKEGDWVTLRSSKQSVYKGRARYIPARFSRYMSGEDVHFEGNEKQFFDDLKHAYLQYQEIVRNLEAERIEKFKDLIKLVRTDLHDDERASMIINEWYDSNRDNYLDEVLKADFGSHLDQHRVYAKFSIDHRIDFFKRVIARCYQKNIRGLEVGSFTLGRFLCQPHPIKFWEAFDDGEAAFLLNEWILFEKYIAVLNDVGERRINRARQMLRDKGLAPIRLQTSGAKIFMTLKLSGKNFSSIAAALGDKADPETRRLLEILQKPYCDFFDFDKPWSVLELQEICESEGLDLPRPEDS